MSSPSSASLANLYEIKVPGEEVGSKLLEQSLITLRTLLVLCILTGVSWWLFLGKQAILLAPPYVAVYQVSMQDVPWFVLLATVIPLVVIAARYERTGTVLGAIVGASARIKHPVAFITLLTFLLTALGTHWVYHAYPLSLDEFLAWFQARTFAGGHILARLPQQWNAFAEALQPIFMRYDHTHGLWVPGYRPLSAAFIALFELIGAGPYTNSILAAGSVVLVAAIAKRIWPEQPQAPVLAALFLAVSPQFLVTGMTAYAMTSHLFFNLLWLLFFLRDDRRGHLAAALTGFVAIGLHQIHIHPFFVLPFMVALLQERRVKLLAFYTIWYAAALGFWIIWRDLATAMAATNNTATVATAEGSFFLTRAFNLIREHDLVGDFILWTTNLARFLGWQAPLVLVLAYAGANTLPDAPRPVKLLAWGIITSLVPYIFFMPGQGHGWGYRYLHVALGSIALLAVHGVMVISSRSRTDDQILHQRILTGLLIFGLAVGIPLRLMQVEHFVRPFANADAYIKNIHVDLAIVNTMGIWFGVDLVRNDPYLQNRPIVMAVTLLNPEKLRLLCTHYKPVVIDYDSLARFGIQPRILDKGDRQKQQEQFGQFLTYAGCQTQTP